MVNVPGGDDAANSLVESQSKTRLEMPNWPFMGTRSMKSHQPGGADMSTFARSPSPSPTIQ
jgi:hypothetical protein